jgi:hypothetical protein
MKRREERGEVAMTTENERTSGSETPTDEAIAVDAMASIRLAAYWLGQVGTGIDPVFAAKTASDVLRNALRAAGESQPLTEPAKDLPSVACGPCENVVLDPMTRGLSACKLTGDILNEERIYMPMASKNCPRRVQPTSTKPCNCKCKD